MYFFSVIALVFTHFCNAVSNKISVPVYLLCSNHVRDGSSFKTFQIVNCCFSIGQIDFITFIFMHISCNFALLIYNST